MSTRTVRLLIVSISLGKFRRPRRMGAASGQVEEEKSFSGDNSAGMRGIFTAIVEPRSCGKKVSF
jgi:hypothetical protein